MERSGETHVIHQAASTRLAAVSSVEPSVATSYASMNTAPSAANSNSAAAPSAAASSNAESITQQNSATGSAQSTGAANTATGTGSGQPSYTGIVFVVNDIAPLKKLKKRQGNTGYLGSGSAFAGASCSPGLSFDLINGQLSANGQLVSTSPGTNWEAFQPSSTTGSITMAFGIQNGNLFWNSSSFGGGSAIFCQLPSGQVDILFAGATDVADNTYPDYPTTCVPVSLSPVSGKSSIALASVRFDTNIFQSQPAQVALRLWLPLQQLLDQTCALRSQLLTSLLHPQELFV